MAYLTLLKKTKEELVFKKSPGLYSWIITAGIFVALCLFANQQSKSFGYAWWWLPVSTAISVYIAMTSLDRWETCDFCRERRNVKLTSQSFFERIFKISPRSVVISLDGISDVVVEETVLKYVKKKARVVSLVSDEGHSYYLTQSWTTDPASQHNEVCRTIKDFLSIES